MRPDKRRGVVQTGTPAVLYNQPAHLFVAGFMGSPPMNNVLRNYS